MVESFQRSEASCYHFQAHVLALEGHTVLLFTSYCIYLPNKNFDGVAIESQGSLFGGMQKAQEIELVDVRVERVVLVKKSQYHVDRFSVDVACVCGCS